MCTVRTVFSGSLFGVTLRTALLTKLECFGIRTPHFLFILFASATTVPIKLHRFTLGHPILDLPSRWFRLTRGEPIEHLIILPHPRPPLTAAAAKQ